MESTEFVTILSINFESVNCISAKGLEQWIVVADIELKSYLYLCKWFEINYVFLIESINDYYDRIFIRLVVK